MRFRVENLGPLREAEVDLSKDLLVLAGPNNSGKTYLAWTVYGLHRANLELGEVLAPWLKTLLESPDHSFALSELVASVNLGTACASAFVPQLHLCFSTSKSQFSETKVSLLDADVSHQGQSTASVEIGGGIRSQIAFHDGRVSCTVMRQRRPEVEPVSEGERDDAETDALFIDLGAGERPRLHARIAKSFSTLIRSRMFASCKLFPVERIAIDVFAKELALNRSELVDRMVDVMDSPAWEQRELFKRSAGRYPWPIRDALHTANDASFLASWKGAFAPLADELEHALLGGSLDLSRAGEIEFAPKSAPTERLPIHLTSSVVKSLASLVFYFRHQARANDFIIIDEPELNLHPDNQRKIARFLAKAVHRGFKVMISTHSDIILRELNQLIMLAKLKPDQRSELGRDAETALAPTKVGVYLIDNGTATSVPVEDTGFSIRTIDDVLNALNEDDQKLYARLFDGPASTA